MGETALGTSGFRGVADLTVREGHLRVSSGFTLRFGIAGWGAGWLGYFSVGDQPHLLQLAGRGVFRFCYQMTCDCLQLGPLSPG